VLGGELRLRACALLARQGLESAVAASLRELGVEGCKLAFRTQLACLRHLAPPTLRVRRVSYTWVALSHVTHYHGYEMPPTAEAMENWLTEAEVLVAMLQGAGHAAA